MYLLRQSWENPLPPIESFISSLWYMYWCVSMLFLDLYSFMQNLHTKGCPVEVCLSRKCLLKLLKCLITFPQSRHWCPSATSRTGNPPQRRKVQSGLESDLCFIKNPRYWFSTFISTSQTFNHENISSQKWFPLCSSLCGSLTCASLLLSSSSWSCHRTGSRRQKRPGSGCSPRGSSHPSWWRQSCGRWCRRKVPVAGAADQQIGEAGQGQQGQRLQGGANINLRHLMSLRLQQMPNTFNSAAQISRYSWDGYILSFSG